MLHNAAEKVDARLLIVFLRNNPSTHSDMLDPERDTALFLACRKGHAIVVRVVLRAGADANSKYGESRYTSSQAANFGGHSDVVEADRDLLDTLFPT